MCKCIYCNSDDLTVSDIIPYALTGAKLTKRFVCYEHNCFTNVNFEEQAIANWDFFRNSLGLTDRKGKEIKFKANLVMDGITIPNVTISNRRSIYEDKKRLFNTKHNGMNVTIGNIEKLKQKKDVVNENIELMDLNNVSINFDFSVEDLIASDEMLRTVAKIAYEWFCYANGIESYDSSIYQDIVNCILKNEPIDNYVKIITYANLYIALKDVCYLGSHGLFQCDGEDGYKYVVYCFWGIVYYKIRIRKLNESDNNYNKYKLYLYDIDGDKREVPFSTLKKENFSSMSAKQAAKKYHAIFTQTLDQLVNTTIWTLAKTKNFVEKLKKDINVYKNPPHDFARLVDYEDFNRVLTIRMLSFLFFHKDEYDLNMSFNENLNILCKTNGIIVINKNENKEYLNDLLKKHNEGTLLECLENEIAFFDKIYNNNQ